MEKLFFHILKSRAKNKKSNIKYSVQTLRVIFPEKTLFTALRVFSAMDAVYLLTSDSM